MDQKETQKSLRAGFIGLVLVVAVFFATFFRGFLLEKFSFSKKENLTEEDKNKKIQKNRDDASLAISHSELFEKISKQEMVILDIRPQDSFLLEHIIDSRNIPVQNFSNSIASLDKSRSYVILDDGNDSTAMDLTVDLSRKNIFKEVRYLSGGFLTWKLAKNPTISFGDPLSLIDQSKVTYISAEELKKVLDEASPGEYFMLDVRKKENFSQGHIKNATNIFLEDLEKERKKIPLGKKVVICDDDSFWAYMAAVRLFDMGIKNTLTLSDGLDSWKEKGYELSEG